MILQNITIANLGGIEHFSYNFEEGLNVLGTRYTDDLALALRVVLNHKEIMPLPRNTVRAGSRIAATIVIDKKTYKILSVPDGERRRFVLKAYNEQGDDVTSEYLYLTDHCAEQDRADAFEGTDQDMPLRFLQYANEELYFARKELSKRTGDLSNLKAFRAYLRYFIAHFQPEPIRDGKQYEIILRSDGHYDVRHKNDRGMPVYLSESEQILFRYLCFLRTAEFWRGFEDLRNLHGVKKPLIIKDFLERIDESIDTSSIINRTMELGRQVIILTLPIKNKDREVFLMGYFSKLNLGIQENDIDRSYPSFEDQLLWRYEDLKNRYMELIEVAAPAVGDDYFNSDDYRYAPVECFKTLSDVYRAIEIAKSDLESKCGIIVRDDGSIETIDDDEDLDQITVYEIVLLPTWFQTAVAA